MARRSGLGKGLSALIPSEAYGGVRFRHSGWSRSPHIRPNRVPARSHFDEESLASLAASIKEVGLLKPVLVRELVGETESYELIAGERRWRAARRAGLSDDSGSGPDSRRPREPRAGPGREPASRRPQPLEEAAAYQQLIDEFGLTHEQVATRMGKGRAPSPTPAPAAASDRAPQRALAERTISAGHARALLGTPDRALQERLVARIKERASRCGPSRRWSGPGVRT